MTIPQINLFWVQRNWKILAIIILLFIVLFRCNNSEPQVAQNYKVSAKDNLKIAREFVKQKNQIIKDYDKTIDALNEKLTENDKSINDLTKSVKLKTAQIKNYKTSDIANYYIELYNVPNDVKQSVGAVELKDTVSRLIINDLIIGQSNKFENRMLNAKLSIENDKFQVANKTIDTLKISISNISLAYENANKDKDFIVKDAEKQLRVQKRKTTFWKITTFVVGVGGIYLLAK